MIDWEHKRRLIEVAILKSPPEDIAFLYSIDFTVVALLTKYLGPEVLSALAAEITHCLPEGSDKRMMELQAKLMHLAITLKAEQN